MRVRFLLLFRHKYFAEKLFLKNHFLLAKIQKKHIKMQFFIKFLLIFFAFFNFREILNNFL